MNHPPHWPHLLSLAQNEVKVTLAALPLPLQEAARAVPVIFEPRPDAAALADGTEPDTLGLFIGNELADGTDSSPSPSEIVLYLENIWEMTEGDESTFREEVQVTLLHELGHYLGLGEIDLEECGLD